MTTNRPRTPSAAEDIAAQQSKIITVLRAQVKNLEDENSQLKDTVNNQQQKMVYLKEVQQELTDLRAAFGNGNVTYYQAMSFAQERKNAEIEQERQRINFERQSKIEAEQTAKREAEEQAVIAENPSLIKYHQEQKAKILQTKEKMLHT